MLRIKHLHNGKEVARFRILSKAAVEVFSRIICYFFVCRPIPEVTELFEELRSTHPQAYISMICGMCSYKNHREAHDLYLQGQEEGILCRFLQ